MLLPVVPHFGHAPRTPIAAPVEGRQALVPVHLQDQEAGGLAGAHPQVDLQPLQTHGGEFGGPHLLGLIEIQVQGGIRLGVHRHQVPPQLDVFAGVFDQDVTVIQVLFEVEDLADFLFPDACPGMPHRHLIVVALVIMVFLVNHDYLDLVRPGRLLFRLCLPGRHQGGGSRTDLTHNYLHGFRLISFPWRQTSLFGIGEFHLFHRLRDRKT